MSWYFLATDILLWLLTAAAVIFIAQALKKPHLRRPWKKVWRSPLAMSSAVVLGFFIAAALVDSVHFYNKNTGEVVSLLDFTLQDLRKSDEKTYSSPFALYLYNKENVEHPDGRTTRERPRLVYGGRHLANIEQRTADITGKILKALFYGIIASLAVSFPVLLKLKINNKNPDKTHKAMLITFFIMLFISISIFILSKWYHVAGTDKVGQDVLYQAIKSIRTGLLIGTLTTLIMLPFAVMLGLMAGYLRGWTDDVIQYIYTTINSIPGVLLIAASILMVQVYIANNPEVFNTTIIRADMRMLFLCFILGITNWTGLCRLIRAETLKLRQTEFVLAARSLGVGPFKIMRRHLLPNVSHVIIISIILDFSALVLAEAVLSYIGIGVDPTTNSWGNMINAARLEMAREPVVWWSLAAAFVFMFALVLAANLFADRVRAAFNPKSAA